MEPRKFEYSEDPHRRFNILTDTWILCSPHRAKRPWQGAQEEVPKKSEVQYDEKCYLCPGNTRINGEINLDYKNTFIFKNDFSALVPEQPAGSINENNLLIAESVVGECYVICFSPNHNQTLATSKKEEIVFVIKEWILQYKKFFEKEKINNVQIFENKGAMMGCSNPHPHCQIWASEQIPQELSKVINSMKKWSEKKDGRCLLCDYLNLELEKNERIVCQNDSFVCLVPFWAAWPFETLILPKRHQQSIDQQTEKEIEDFADILRRITCRYDNLFQCSFPYSSGIHQQPTDNKDYSFFHWHMHFYPPLLRSSTVKKHFVGFELLGEQQRDLTAEQACERLVNVSEIHFWEQ